MSETRLEKYRKYRESLNEVKANSKSEEAVKMRDANVVTEKYNTTSTLPLDEVLGQIDQEDDDVLNKMSSRKKIQIAIAIAVGVLLVAGIVIFAIVAWGK